MDNQRQLHDMGAELESLSLELARLRKELKVLVCRTSSRDCGGRGAIWDLFGVFS